tara:strand:- start:1440 stop:3443 length:2004 start_codon:yes stop_codon:yes gene_type:complete
LLIPLIVGEEQTINIISIGGISAGTDVPVDIFVDELVPEFVSLDHQKFVSFLKQYYVWMQQEGNPKFQSFGLDDLNDIDDTIEEFKIHFYNQYLQNFPVELDSKADLDKVLKRIVDVYKIKGTEESYRTLFRILFNQTPRFHYPSNDLMRLSDGNWVEPTILKTTQTNNIEDLFNMIGRQVVQRKPEDNSVESYGFVESVVPFGVSGYEVAEIELSGVFGSFRPEGYIECELEDGNVIREYIYPGISDIKIVDGGTGYNITDTINIGGTGEGRNASAKISDVSSTGQILAISVKDSGVNYRSSDKIVLSINTLSGSGATLGCSGGVALDTRPGFYSGDDGLLGSDRRIQDNNYYQDFSYVVKSTMNLNEYGEILKRLIHPAGLKLFSQALFEELKQIDTGVTESRIAYEVPIAGHYTPYLFNTIRNLRDNGTGGGSLAGGSLGVDLYPSGYGFSAAEGGTYSPEFGTSVHNPYGLVHGTSGPLGGFTHGANTNTLNRPQGEQFAVENGGISTGSSTLGVPGASGNHWIVYPHPTSRGVGSMPLSNIGSIIDLELYNDDDFPSSDTWTVNEIVSQTNSFGQDALGVILSEFKTGNTKVLTITNIGGGQFLDRNVVIHGGSVGRLVGASGSSAHINSIRSSSTSSHSIDTPFSYIKVNDFVHGILKDID